MHAALRSSCLSDAGFHFIDKLGSLSPSETIECERIPSLFGEGFEHAPLGGCHRIHIPAGWVARSLFKAASLRSGRRPDLDALLFSGI